MRVAQESQAELLAVNPLKAAQRRELIIYACGSIYGGTTCVARCGFTQRYWTLPAPVMKAASLATPTSLCSAPLHPQASGEMGDITGLFMVDDEGTLSTTDVKAKFINGKPQAIEAKFNMRSQFEWDRFMRFMDRYAAENDLGFEK